MRENIRLILSWITYLRLLVFLLVISILSAPAVAEQNSLKILRITPEGLDVVAGRQIVIAFDRSVVPIGRMERRSDEIPAVITPEINCQWRWLDTKNLACQLNEQDQLKPSTKYQIRFSVGEEERFQAVDGSKLEESYLHSFTTQRPQVKHYWFDDWRAPGWPRIYVAFDQAVEKSSVDKHIYFVGADKQMFPLRAEEMEGFSGTRWRVEPREELPLDTSISLHISPGVKSLKGDQLGVEDRTIVQFDTFGEFRFLGVRCRPNSGSQVLNSVDTIVDLQKRCDPTSPVELAFSVPVIKEEVQRGMRFVPDLRGGRKDFDPWEHIYSYSSLSSAHSKDSLYTVSLPIFLKAFDTYTLTAEVNSIRDEFGRGLVEPVDFQFETDHRPPKFEFGGSLSVLESEVDTHVPIFITNLESLTLNYKTILANSLSQANSKIIRLPDAQDIAYAHPLKMRELIEAKSGLIYGTFSTNPSTHHLPKWFFNQVTPFHVHLKLGHFNSLVWITRLDNGGPVKDANVEVLVDSFHNLKNTRDVKAVGKSDDLGLAKLPGLNSIDPKLVYANQWEERKPRLFVRVEKNGALAYLPVYYDFRAREYGTYSHSRTKYGHIKTWGTTAQGVYRVGDNIQYKIYVRNQDTFRFNAAPTKTYKLEIKDPTNKIVHSVEKLKLNSFGAIDGEFLVPRNSAVGWYRFRLSADFTDHNWTPIRVLVSDFTPSPFKVTSELKGDSFTSGEKIEVLTKAQLHAGGPYVDAGTRVVAQLQAHNFTTSNPRLKKFSFYPAEPPNRLVTTVHNVSEKTDRRGEFDTSFRIEDKHKVNYGRIFVESAVRDDRGKYVASSDRATFYGRDRYVGLWYDGWVLEKEKPTEVQLIVVDQNGEPQMGSEINVVVEREEVKASRVKGAGNAYLTKYVEEWVKEAECSVESSVEPVSCSFTPEGIGKYRIIANISDEQGRDNSSVLRRWAVGEGAAIWRSYYGNKLDIVPEQTSYKIGDTARFLIKNPFPGAKALFSIERYGVLRSWTATLNNSTEIVEFPIEKDHLPGVYLSAIITSPRVEKPQEDGVVDLGKPAFRIGYATVPVSDPAKQLKVKVEVSSESFKPRDQVGVELSVKDNAGENVKTELAVAVLDEAVFDLILGGESYFDPYKGFYTLGTLDVVNYNILRQLVGQRKFEKKGANPGGGGGEPDLKSRDVSKFVSYWNPSLKPDADGRVSFSFEAPDNLTAWRVLALAVDKNDMMGLGQGSFKVNKPTEIRPALPNQVTEGDSFTARFTLMNRTDDSRELKVRLKAKGNILAVEEYSTIVTAEPYKREIISLPVTTKESGIVEFRISAADEIDSDALSLRVPINKRKSLDVAANYGSSVEDEVTELVSFPQNIRTDVGKLSVELSSSVISSLVGAFKYIKDYPYTCWEQKLTKAVTASQYIQLAKYLPDDFSWEGAEKIPASTLLDAARYQAPNGGMTYYQAQNEYVSPYLSAYTAIAFNWLRDYGYSVPKQVEDRLDKYLLEFLRKDIQPNFYSESMASTVRAVALAALAHRGKVSKSDINRYKKHSKQMSLFGSAHYLSAVTAIGDRELEKLLVNRIIAHANESGGKFVLTETLDTRFARILESALRTNCAALSAIISYNKKRIDDKLLQDIPYKLVRTITQSRKQRDRWENTQENIFCMNALVDYSKEYENVTPSMTLKVSLDQQQIGEGGFKDFKDKPLVFDREIGIDDPGRESEVKISRQGTGRYYHATRLFYSTKELTRERVNSGIDVRREYSVEKGDSWRIVDADDELKLGDLVKVDLFLSLPAARNFVVVDDAVPGGLEPVNTQLATASRIDADKGSYTFAKTSFWYERRDWFNYGWSRWSFYHKELRHDSVRFYSEYLPPGNYHLSYVAQVIAPGNFDIMPARAEEMYDPDVYGKGKPSKFLVRQAD